MPKRSLIALTTAALLAAPAAAQAGTAAPEPGTVIEKKVRSAAPHHRQVRETFVRIYDPLPEEVGEHPPACDWIQYLRFRNAGGPKEARDADAVYVMIPGLLGGAGSFDQVARNTIRRGDDAGRDVEYWALDRRANCVEDHRGIKAAAKAQDATIAWDYYWGGKPVNGHTFAGFVPPEDAEYLSHFGIERTMEDWYTVLTTGISGQPRRAKKVICGGHSLGGPLTAIFASWDFDGDPETKQDAGYKQCAGLIGLDTTVSVSGSEESSGASEIGDLIAASGAAPYINVPPLTPETIEVPAVFGIGSFFDPQGTDLIKELPHSDNIDLSQRVLFSKDAAHFASNNPSIRDFNLTNETTFGGIFDDNSNGVSILRASIGQVVGGPLADKNFPAPDDTLALPEEPATPLYSWESYRLVGTPEHPSELNDSGEPYTTRESEVSDLRQMSRSLFEAPADFTEQYFPVRILSDLAPAESGGFEQMRYDGPSLRPILLVQAGDSDDNSPPDTGLPTKGTAPNDLKLSREIIIPGYNHLDVATAAWRQNDARPEPTSKALVSFGLRAVRAALKARGQ
jgi:pimeloyl-ACP methyl ester carboxylesterase